jgi:hypothetical protein
MNLEFDIKYYPDFFSGKPLVVLYAKDNGTIIANTNFDPFTIKNDPEKMCEAIKISLNSLVHYVFNNKLNVKESLNESLPE